MFARFLVVFLLVESEAHNPFQFLTLGEDQVVTFSHAGSKRYGNLLLSGDLLYLTGNGFVFKLNAREIDDKNGSVYSERSFEAMNNTDNFIMYLNLRQLVNDLIICTTNAGKPQILHLKPTNLGYNFEYNGLYLCPGVPERRNLALITYDEENEKKIDHLKGVLYSAVWLTEKSRYGIFRKDTENDRHFLRSEYSPYWLWEPEFLKIFEDKFHVYYFLNENSVEDSVLFGQTTRVARIARVCKNDEGIGGMNVWSTYRKLQVQCSRAGSQTLFSKLKLVTLLADDVLMAVFEDETVLGTVSNLCELTLGEVKEAFLTKGFLNLNSTRKFEYSNLGCDEQYSEILNADDYQRQDIYEFLSSNTILRTKLQFDFKFWLNYKITHVSVEAIDKMLQVLYLASEGYLLKVTRQCGGGDKEVEYKLISVVDFQKSNIRETLVNKKLDLIYVSTDEEVLQIRLDKHCYKYTICGYCRNDPHCVWMLNRCENRNPLKEDGELCGPLNGTSVNANKNETVVLKCGAENALQMNTKLYLTQHLKWYKDDQPIDSYQNFIQYKVGQDGVLVLLSVDFNYAGVYNCFVDSVLISTIVVVESNTAGAGKPQWSDESSTDEESTTISYPVVQDETSFVTSFINGVKTLFTTTPQATTQSNREPPEEDKELVRFKKAVIEWKIQFDKYKENIELYEKMCLNNNETLNLK